MRVKQHDKLKQFLTNLKKYRNDVPVMFLSDEFAFLVPLNKQRGAICKRKKKETHEQF